MMHHLKTDPQPFQCLADSTKTFELRRADRPFNIGDELYLRETSHSAKEMQEQGLEASYTGRVVIAKIIGILPGPCYGLAEGWVILSIKVTHALKNNESF